MSIETIYRARVDLDFDDHERIGDQAFEYCFGFEDLEMELHRGSPASSPYVECEGPSFDEVEGWYNFVKACQEGCEQ